MGIFANITVGSLTIGFLPVLVTSPSLGAERLTLSYGVLQRSISIDALDIYARTGKLDDELATYVQYAPKEQLAEFRKALLTPVPLKTLEISQFLYTPTGERLLKRISEIIQGESPTNKQIQGIRAALILASADKEGLTLLNLLHKFPSREMSINLAKCLDLVGAFNSLMNQSQGAIAQINQEFLEKVNNSSLATNSFPLDLRKGGTFSWEQKSIKLSRNSERIFPVDIYIPESTTPRPVIIISHGLGNDRSSFAYLAKRLASYGFVVAVPEHPGSDNKQLQGLLSGISSEVTPPQEFIERPLDIQFLLDELTRLNQSNDRNFRQRFNLQQVGVIGQSFGGYTALALAGAPLNFTKIRASCPPSDNSLNISLLLQCLAVRLEPKNYNLTDSRIKAAIAINPLTSVVMGKESLNQIKIPVMLVSGSIDTVTPALPEQIQPFSWLQTPSKYLVLINNGTHFSTILDSPDASIPIPEALLGKNRSFARLYVNVLSVAFMQSFVNNDSSYQGYLSPEYVNSVSQVAMPISILEQR
ncbi:hypothetical protein IJ00_25135 [Calothrix sp. 336/3]|nr:hypothetical protein IJ00_25135 [Calothrix sp. 336/3]